MPIDALVPRRLGRRTLLASPFNVVDTEVITPAGYLDLRFANSGRQTQNRAAPPGRSYFGIGLAAEMAARVTGKPPATNDTRVRARFRGCAGTRTKAKNCRMAVRVSPCATGSSRRSRAAGAQS
jgi:hypothetical protein